MARAGLGDQSCQGTGAHFARRLLAGGEQVVDVPPKLSARTSRPDPGHTPRARPGLTACRRPPDLLAASNANHRYAAHRYSHHRRSGHQDLKPELPLDLPLKSRGIVGLAFELLL